MTKRAVPNPMFIIWGWICLIISLIGFWPSFIEPSLAGTFTSFSPSISWHVIFTTLWLVLMISQPIMVKMGKINLHRLFGFIGIFIAFGVVYTGFIVQIEVMRPYAKLDDELNAVGQPFFRFIALSIYAIFVVVALALVKKYSSWHKRLMLLGTLALLQAPLVRMYGNLFDLHDSSGPLGVFTQMGLMVLFIIWDRLANGRFHPASIWGSILIALIVFSISPFVQSNWWHKLATQWAGT